MSDTNNAPQVMELASPPDRSRLFEIASEQGGYFTTAQAKSCGFSWALLSHHAKADRYIRVRRGLYRFREYPSSPREDVLAAWLAIGRDVAVVSHESALDVLGLSDVIPSSVHLAVPRSKRNLPRRSGVRVHTTSRPLRAEDRVVRDGMAVTSATRSILDSAEAGTAPEQIEIAVSQAIERGMAIAQQLQKEASERGRRVAMLIKSALQRVKS